MPKREESINTVTRAAKPEARDVPQTGQARDAAGPTAHMLTINIPMDEAIDVAAFPVKMAGRVLAAKGGLPLYAGLGVLAAAQVIEWPVAALAGVSYAVLRRWGPLRPAAVHPPETNGKASGKAAGRANGKVSGGAEGKASGARMSKSAGGATAKPSGAATSRTSAKARSRTAG
ncbi:MAG TPA: hypothetical protein VLW50_11990 [Streptosporangiaceae bacterium]|nr:hypothetical protein [Streptosporangiaceae bacterium]